MQVIAIIFVINIIINQTNQIIAVTAIIERSESYNFRRELPIARTDHFPFSFLSLSLSLSLHLVVT